jgi:hypothetical protein
MAKNVKATSIKAAAAILKDEMRIDAVQAMGLVKRAKDGGCLAFDQRGCVDMAVLKRWIGENKDDLVKGDLSLKDQKLNEEIRKLRIANDLKEKELVRRSLVIEAHAKMAEQVRKLLEQKLENEYPGLVAGLDTAQARVFGKRLHDSIIQEFKGFAKAWAF